MTLKREPLTLLRGLMTPSSLVMVWRRAPIDGIAPAELTSENMMTRQRVDRGVTCLFMVARNINEVTLIELPFLSVEVSPRATRTGLAMTVPADDGVMGEAAVV